MTSLLLLAFAASAFAKRTSDYVPPPYLIRVGRSIIGLAFLGTPVLVLVVIIAVVASSAEIRGRIVRACVAVAVVLLLGSFIAALDGLNDEGWNPALYGSVFVAGSFPVGTWFALPVDFAHRRLAISATLFAAGISTCGLAGFGMEVLHWLSSSFAWPVSW